MQTNDVKKKRILLVSCEGLGHGGVQAVMMNIVRNLCHEYIFDVLLFTSEKRYYDEEFLSYGGNIHRIPNYEGDSSFSKRADYYIRGFHLYREAKKLLEKYDYQAIHCHNRFEAGILLLASHNKNIPVRIIHEHVIDRPQNFVMNALNKLYMRLIKKHSTAFLGCSEETCRSFYGEDVDWRVVCNPYDENRYRFSELKNDGVFHITQVGAYNENKNQMFSISVFSEIVKKHPNSRLHFVGFDCGGYLQTLKDEVVRLNLEDRVSFHPHDFDVFSLLQMSSASLFPSQKEGFGIVAVEAQAVGVTCFASDTVPESTQCGGCVYLPLENGAEYWADKILEYYENGAEHHEYDCSRFSMASFSETIRNIYEGNE